MCLLCLDPEQLGRGFKHHERLLSAEPIKACITFSWRQCSGITRGCCYESANLQVYALDVYAMFTVCYIATSIHHHCHALAAYVCQGLKKSAQV